MHVTEEGLWEGDAQNAPPNRNKTRTGAFQRRASSQRVYEPVLNLLSDQRRVG